MDTTTRNATLADLAGLLRFQHTRKLDVVAPATAITARNGLLQIAGTEALLTDDGVTPTAGIYRPTAVADEGLASKLGIPTGYLRRMRTDRPDLYDANVNGWLQGSTLPPAMWTAGQGGGTTTADPDPRSFMVRCFRGDDGGEGICRAVLSDSYRIIDNLDVLTAALHGVQTAGAEVEVQACDLTERRMYVRIYSPDVAVHAPQLLAGYRSPFTGAQGTDNPLIHAGFVLTNSEVGSGAWSITPRLYIEVCDNGATISKDAMRSVHLGGKLDHGVVRASAETQQANLELITSQARDAVATFLDRDYVAGKIADMEAQAGAPVRDAAAVVQTVTQALRFPEDVQAGVLDHFIAGGQLTAGGVMQAVTSYAQVVEDADQAADMEDSALEALTLAVRAAR